MKRIIFSFAIVVLSTSLTACQKKASQEVIHYETRSDIYTHFITDPKTGKEKLIRNYGLGTDELLQSLLLNQEKPSKATLTAFSQLVAEVYHKAMDTSLTPSENTIYAETLGRILGGLMGLRDQVVAKREARFLAGWYDYSELDKRWLALLTDIVSLSTYYPFSENVLEIARGGAVDEFAQSLMQSGYAKQMQDYDLLKDILYLIDRVTSARFNGYVQETGHSVVRSAFDIKLLTARNNMNYQISRRSN